MLIKEKGPLSSIKQELSSCLKKTFKLSEVILEKPRNPEHGHLSWPLFDMAKKQKISPQSLAKELSQSLQKSLPDFIKSCEPLSGFMNFVFQDDYIQKN